MCECEWECEEKGKGQVEKGQGVERREYEKGARRKGE